MRIGPRRSAATRTSISVVVSAPAAAVGRRRLDKPCDGDAKPGGARLHATGLQLVTVAHVNLIIFACRQAL